MRVEQQKRKKKINERGTKTCVNSTTDKTHTHTHTNINTNTSRLSMNNAQRNMWNETAMNNRPFQGYARSLTISSFRACNLINQKNQEDFRFVFIPVMRDTRIPHWCDDNDDEPQQQQRNLNKISKSHAYQTFFFILTEF